MDVTDGKMVHVKYSESTVRKHCHRHVHGMTSLKTMFSVVILQSIQCCGWFWVNSSADWRKNADTNSFMVIVACGIKKIVGYWWTPNFWMRVFHEKTTAQKTRSSKKVEIDNFSSAFVIYNNIIITSIMDEGQDCEDGGQHTFASTFARWYLSHTRRRVPPPRSGEMKPRNPYTNWLKE